MQEFVKYILTDNTQKYIIWVRSYELSLIIVICSELILQILFGLTYFEYDW